MNFRGGDATKTSETERREWVYAVVKRIPRGKVSTYGRVARAAGLPGRARFVGRALGALDEKSRVPWHRVLNAQGRISFRGAAVFTLRHRRRLQWEGVEFDRRGVVSLDRFGWGPPPQA